MNDNEPLLVDASSNGVKQRKKLELKPRSAQAEERSRRRSASARGDPFGAARPREEVLKERGLDAKELDSRIEKKSVIDKFTRDQEAQLDILRAELTNAEALFRDANEKELPEEEFRVQAEEKRSQLNDLVDKFSKLNAATKKDDDGSIRKDAGWPSRSTNRGSPSDRFSGQSYNADNRRL